MQVQKGQKVKDRELEKPQPKFNLTKIESNIIVSLKQKLNLETEKCNLLKDAMSLHNEKYLAIFNGDETFLGLH